jgi:hypothetical protein
VKKRREKKEEGKNNKKEKEKKILRDPILRDIQAFGSLAASSATSS